MNEFFYFKDLDIGEEFWYKDILYIKIDYLDDSAVALQGPEKGQVMTFDKELAVYQK